MLKIALAILAICASTPTILVAQNPHTEAPNIVLIMADDLGWGDVEYPQDRTAGDTYEGHPLLRTPHLADMAASGLKFHRFYAASPVCSPTRASLLTGRHGFRHGIDGALMPGDQGKIRNCELTIAEIAKTQGYRTGHFGKWHVGSLTKHTYDMRRGREGNFRDYSPPWDNGYDEAFASENWMPTYDPYDVFPHNKAAQAAYFTGPSDPELTYRVPKDARVDNLDESEIVTDQAISFIRRAHQRGQPFFTTIWFATPHIPLRETPDTSYDGLGLSTEKRRYCEAVTKMDEQIGRLRRLLSDLEISDDTLLMFTSDNGPQRRNVGSTGGLRGQKASLWEGGIRVPAVMEWCGHIRRGTSTHAPATSSDLMPTLLDLWGVSMPDDRPIDGASLRAILLDGKQRRTDNYRFCSVHNQEQMVMDHQHKLISIDGGRRYQLYDLLSDPTERKDLLNGASPASMEKKRDELISRLHEWIESSQRSSAGGDFQTRVSSATGAILRADVVSSLELEPIGEDSHAAPIYRDRYEITEGAFENSRKASLFLERQYATLPESLKVDSHGQPRAAGHPKLPPGGVLPAGEVCHAFLVHFDPIDGDDGNHHTSQVETTITFQDPILAVIAQGDLLEKSDFLAFAEPRFPTGNSPPTSSRGMLVGEDSDGGWKIAPDGRTITIRMTAGPDEIDQLRVLTSARIPGPRTATARAVLKPSE